MGMSTRWRFVLPVMMIFLFLATLGYREVRDWLARAEDAKRGWFSVAIWDGGDTIEEGLILVQAIGLIPAVLLIETFAPTLDGWRRYSAIIASIILVWFVIGLAIDRRFERSRPQPLRLR